MTAVKRVSVAGPSDRRVLIVDDDIDFAESLRDSLELHKYSVKTVYSMAEVRAALEGFDPMVALLDIRLGTENGLQLIPELKEHAPRTKCVMVTGHAELDTAIDALQHGADDYLCKPVRIEDVVHALETCMEKSRLEEERERAETALRASEARLRAIVDNSPSLISLRDLEGRLLVANRKFLEWCNRDANDVRGKTVREVFPASFADACERQDRQVLASGEATSDEIEFALSDGSVRRANVCTFPVLDVHRVSVGLGNIATDVTELHRIEEQLHQSRKLEAVGRLTGGIAHDFNNLLLAITLNLELLRENVDKDKATSELADTALMAVGRAAGLTQRLLAFSSRQPLSPIPTDVNRLIRNVLKLVGRTIGETFTLRTRLSRSAGTIIVDRGQLESTIINLMLNARDAMPEGGRIHIRTDAVALVEGADELHGELPPGDFVRITVSDDGCGMSPEIARRAVEPFFTTKEVGEGSGLGLSMVFGFMKQSGGHLAIESELGKGTTVRLFLPASVGSPDWADKETHELESLPRGSETVMVVEDDRDVREFVARTLETLGYSVIAAADGPAALALIDGGAKVDLVFSDVVLPGGMTGWQVVEEARRRKPGIKVLLTSGYTGSKIDHHRRVAESVDLLPKPYKREDLAVTLRGILDDDG